MGWHLNGELSDNRLLKDRKAGKPLQLVAVFSYYVQPHGGEKNFNQQAQYPGVVVYSRADLEEGKYPALQGIPHSLQQEALALFAERAENIVIPFARPKQAADYRDAEREERPRQMAAEIPGMTL